ncbi:unnamed protein product, partial [Symbiodinium sp. KB8]
ASGIFVEVRLRESPEMKGRCHAAGGSSLRASADFEAFSRQAKGRDRAEARERDREAKRREEAQQRTDAMIQEAADKRRDQAGFKQAMFVCASIVLPLALLTWFASIAPGSAIAAALLASATVPLSCCFSFWSLLHVAKTDSDDFHYGKYFFRIRFGIQLSGILALALLTVLTVQHVRTGFGWTAVIIWPVPLCSGLCFCACLVDVHNNHITINNLGDNSKAALERERKSAQLEVRNRSIRFEGSVICERGRPCVASWPGKYEGAWEALVSQGRNRQVSAAVVFLPHGTDDYGKCDSIPLAEGLPGTCWCTPLYGEQKPWGCRWFTKWRENIETAVESGAELEVYYFQNRVGQGKVKSFDTAGDDNLQREEINNKQKDFEGSPEFEQALHAGLDNLSKWPRGDGSSQYSREARRLFLASLSETEREFIAASEGLGNSQKAEVAWLQKKGYAYWEVDVSTWLPGEGVEKYVPASAEPQPQMCSRQEDDSPISLSTVPLRPFDYNLQAERCVELATVVHAEGPNAV